MALKFHYIQTFYVNPDLVSGAPQVMLTSVDLFFKAKPSITNNISGMDQPGITVWICEYTNAPLPDNVLANSIQKLSYDKVNTSSNAQLPTTVGFSQSPVVLQSNKYYGICIRYDDPAFDIWINKQGDALVGVSGKTNIPSSGSQGKFDGYLYQATSISAYKTFSDRDIKFKVNVAKFTSNTVTVSLVNKDYEFFTVGSTSGQFINGEYVYQDISNSSGTITVVSNSKNCVGSGTSFTNYSAGDYIAISNGSAYDVIKIGAIYNSTNLSFDRYPAFSATSIGYKVPPVGVVFSTDYTQKKVYLKDSNASATKYFSATSTIVGQRSKATAVISSVDRYRIDQFQPKFLIGNPTNANYSIHYKTATTSNTLNSTQYDMRLLKFNDMPYEGYILSRSTEVQTSSGLYGDKKKSLVANVTLNVITSEVNRFGVPYMHTGELDFTVYQNDINSNTYIDTWNYDSEVPPGTGLAKSKYISKKMTFTVDKDAEDLVVFLTGYRPANTEIRVYAKIYNSKDNEGFDVKRWTRLSIQNNTAKYSTNYDDMVEYSYMVPPAPQTRLNIPSKFNTQSGNNVITTSIDCTSSFGGWAAGVQATSLVKVFNRLNPKYYMVSSVQSANSTALVLDQPVTDSNLVGDVSVDLLMHRETAFRNVQNANTVRYVTSSSVVFDSYNSVQIKVVLLSDNPRVAPRVDQLAVVGVSA